jgi:hypothetical protein
MRSIQNDGGLSRAKKLSATSRAKMGVVLSCAEETPQEKKN